MDKLEKKPILRKQTHKQKFKQRVLLCKKCNTYQDHFGYAPIDYTCDTCHAELTPADLVEDMHVEVIRVVSFYK